MKTIVKSTCLGLFFLVLGAAVMTGCTAPQESVPVPERQGWVTDHAGILQPADKKRIGAALAAYEKETCHQIYVLIINSLAGEDVADFSQRTATSWQIGQTGLGNGFLVTIAMAEGTVRIETGSAFQWFIDDGTADRVLQEVMFPLFRQDKFVAGLERGLEEIMTAGRLKPVTENHRPAVCRP